MMCGEERALQCLSSSGMDLLEWELKKTTLFICEHSTFALQFLRHNTFIDHSLDPYHEYHCYFSQA